MYSSIVNLPDMLWMLAISNAFECLWQLQFCIFLGLTILRGRECKFCNKEDFWQCAISRRDKIHLFLYARLKYYVMAFMSVRLWASSCQAHKFKLISWLKFSVNFLFSLIHVNECVINLWWSYEKGKWQEQLFASKNELWQLAN